MSENGWKTPADGELPLEGKVVELILHGDGTIRRGKCLWNSFWLLDDGTRISGGRVAGWRNL